MLDLVMVCKPGEGQELLSQYIESDALLGNYVAGQGPCRLWPYGKSHGYGRVEGFHTIQVHRLTLEAHAGPAPDGKPHALHSCRNKHCNSVQHLRWGNDADNAKDRIRDGTHRQGEDIHQSRLSESEVLEIRSKHATSSVSQRQLASDYGVSQSTISLIVNRKFWSWLKDEIRK